LIFLFYQINIFMENTDYKISSSIEEMTSILLRFYLPHVFQKVDGLSITFHTILEVHAVIRQ